MPKVQGDVFSLLYFKTDRCMFLRSWNQTILDISARNLKNNDEVFTMKTFYSTLALACVQREGKDGATHK